MAQDKSSATVYSTSDYSKFTTLVGNRHINPLHIERLCSAIKGKNLLHARPITVNEKLHIIDGQHRFIAARELGVEIYYIVVPGLTIEDIPVLNSQGRNWNAVDFAESYADLGFRAYQDYLAFKAKYNFGHSDCVLMLAQASRGISKPWKQGLFKIADLAQAEKDAEMILEFEPFFKESIRRTQVVNAFYKTIHHPNYDHERMLSKMEIIPQGMIQDMTTINDTLRLLEGIYNFRAQKPVRLY